MITGCDISYAQARVDYNQLHQSGKVAFLYHRVSYGTNPNDDDGVLFTTAHDQCKKLGIPFGCYMFWIAGQDGAQQAEHFLNAANGRYGNLAVMVDVEEGSGAVGWGLTGQANINNLAKTLQVIRQHCGQPIIYTNADTWNSYFGGTDAFSGHRLWVASYGVPAGQPIMPNGWRNWAVHQYTSGAQLPGISGFVDLDVARSIEDLKR